MNRETLAIQLDADLLRALDAAAAAAKVDRHEMARLALKLGLALLRRETKR